MRFARPPYYAFQAVPPAGGNHATVRYRTQQQKIHLHSESGLQSAHLSPKIKMPVQTPKPRFKHQPVHGMPERVESFCVRCGQFVGASDNPRSLKIAEKAHLCPESKRSKS